MAQRAAIVTGASSGIGLAIARVLGEEGYALTIAGRRVEKLAAAARELRDAGLEVCEVAGSVAEEDVVREVVDTHRRRYGRLDVLVNNAGVGIGAPVGETLTKRLDLQLAVDLRSVILFHREAVELLRAAGAEHRNALVVNVASVSGKAGEAWLSVYSAAKHGVVGFTEAMNKELGAEGIKSCALCPAFVDTDMSEFIKGQIDAAEMITPADVAAAVRYLLHTSPACVVPEIIFQRPGGAL
jgi:NAD(P)-dependent dehydrogenase (short-subunit alcohol dehydrogenase family)